MNQHLQERIFQINAETRDPRDRETSLQNTSSNRYLPVVKHLKIETN
jgi:hypothetical protein